MSNNSKVNFFSESLYTMGWIRIGGIQNKKVHDIKVFKKRKPVIVNKNEKNECPSKTLTMDIRLNTYQPQYLPAKTP